jgi:signal transduction histidine kinase
MNATQQVLELAAGFVDHERTMTVGAFLGLVAHELAQPLTALRIDAGACLRWLNQSPPNLSAVRAALERITIESREAGDVIDRLRDCADAAEPQHVVLDIDTLEPVVVIAAR